MSKKTERDVRHGCVDCLHREAPVAKEPCKGCERWSNWVDKKEVTANA